jgi:hypothetical protein
LNNKIVTAQIVHRRVARLLCPKYSSGRFAENIFVTLKKFLALTCLFPMLANSSTIEEGVGHANTDNLG